MPLFLPPCAPCPSIFLSNRGDKQVIAPFLITLRVANRTALTSEDITTGNIIGSIHFDGHGKSMDSIGTFADEPDANPEISLEMGLCGA